MDTAGTESDPEIVGAQHEECDTTAADNEKESKTQKVKRALNRLKEQKTTVLMVILLNILVPTFDVATDIGLSWSAFIANVSASENGSDEVDAGALIGGIILIPIILNTIFTFIAWKSHKEDTQRWTLILVFLQLWPQYLAFKMLYKSAIGQTLLRPEKKRLERNISSLEPYLESIPQVLIQTSIMIQLRLDREEFRVIFGSSTFFLISYSLSIFSATFGLAKFLKSGPCHLIPSEGYFDGYLTLGFCLVFVSSMAGTLQKGFSLGFLIGHRNLTNSTSNIVENSTSNIVEDRDRYLVTLAWCAIVLLPQFILSLASLAISLKKDFWSVICTFPALVLCPVFSNFTFGRQQNGIAISKRLTIVNIMLTLLTNTAVLGLSLGLFGDKHEIVLKILGPRIEGRPMFVLVFVYNIILLPFFLSLLSLLTLIHCKDKESRFFTGTQFGVLFPNDMDTQYLVRDDKTIVKSPMQTSKRDNADIELEDTGLLECDDGTNRDMSSDKALPHVFKNGNLSSSANLGMDLRAIVRHL